MQVLPGANRQGSPHPAHGRHRPEAFREAENMIRHCAAALTALILGVNFAASASAQKSGYAPVNGLKMYYEIHGSGEPLVLLHGGVCTIEVCFGKLIPALAKTRRVIAMEQQGHGHTGDIDRPLTNEQMADDTADLLRQLKVTQADFFGYSMGGMYGLRLAIRYPALVRKLVIFGSMYSNDGWVPEVLASFTKLRPEDIPRDFRVAYEKAAPDPSQWPVLVGKIVTLVNRWNGWSPRDLQAIQAPVMVMIGDRDITRPEHAVELYRLLPKGQLAVLPGTDHFAPVNRADWLLAMMVPFYEATLPSAE
jgi:pimeloyl-ACP methyl ester carboxylesterase